MTEILVEDRDGVRRITINRPEKKNALTVAMYAGLAEAVRGADAADAGAMLIDAAGATFTAGNDLRDFLEHPAQDDDAPVFRFMRAVVDSDVPIVAAVRGNAIGIGTTMLLHCDLVYASATARFRTPFVDLGVTPEFASSVTFARAMGAARAGALLLLGESLDAAGALQAGIVTAVVDDAALGELAWSKAHALAAKPREALRASRRLVRDPHRAELHEVIRRETSIFTARLRSAEAKAAFEAFLTPKVIA